MHCEYVPSDSGVIAPSSQPALAVGDPKYTAAPMAATANAPADNAGIERLKLAPYLVPLQVSLKVRPGTRTRDLNGEIRAIGARC